MAPAIQRTKQPTLHGYWQQLNVRLCVAEAALDPKSIRSS
jgi:hypothetical protein